MLIADGIDPSELMSTTGIVKERKQRKSRPAKYVYTDDTGVEKT
jgi:DNA-binding protein H-NS